MSSHLPECLRIVGKSSGPCICWLLRAYGNRRYMEGYEKGQQDGFDSGSEAASQSIRKTLLGMARDLPRWGRNDITHYRGCWQSHPECFAIETIQALVALGWDRGQRVVYEDGEEFLNSLDEGDPDE